METHLYNKNAPSAEECPQIFTRCKKGGPPMKKKFRDIEGCADTIGINLNSQSGFGIGNPPMTLTSIITKQSSPENIIDNIEKKT